MTKAGILKAAAIAALSAALAIPSQALAYRFKAPFSYFADGQDLRVVLSTFARTQSLECLMTPSVQGRISGRFSEVPAKSFLAAMSDAYDIGWYVQGREIHFFTLKDKRKAFIPVRSGSAAELVASLRDSGIISSDLPYRLNSQGNMLTIEGPQDYVAQVRESAAAFESVQSEKIVMRVFPLKHAWAEDQTVTSMDKSVTIPGIASILRAMILGNSLQGQTVTQQKATVEKLGGKGLAAVGNTPAEQPKTGGNSTPVSNGSISIMADPRVNAVLVSDAAYRMSYYKQVISQLDKPVELVEIHAAIVDIDADTTKDLGINLAGSRTSHNTQTGGTLGGQTGISSSGATSGTLDTAGAILSTIYSHGSDFFMARIKALEETNEARVLGRPSVLTIDNIQATLENTTTYYVQVQGYQAVDLYKVEAGTVLRVTPHIIHEGGRTSIKLAVSVQDNQDTSDSVNTQTGVPPIKQTKINTQAVINAGQSLLVGGYYYEQRQKGTSGVPILKDIPVVGNLFKTTSKSGKRMERLILLTPRIIHPNMNNIPRRTDSPKFRRTPWQADYELKEPLPGQKKKSGHDYSRDFIKFSPDPAYKGDAKP